MKSNFNEDFVENILNHDRPFTMILNDYTSVSIKIARMLSAQRRTGETSIKVLQIREGAIKYIYIQSGDVYTPHYERFRAGMLVAVVIDKELLHNEYEDKVYIIKGTAYEDSLMTQNTELFDAHVIKEKCFDKYMEKYMDNLDIRGYELKDDILNNIKKDVEHSILSGNDLSKSVAYDYKLNRGRINLHHGTALDIMLHPEKEEEIFTNVIKNSTGNGGMNEYLVRIKVKNAMFQKLYNDAKKKNAPDWRFDLIAALKGLGDKCRSVTIEYLADNKTEITTVYRNCLLAAIYKGYHLSMGDLVKRSEWVFPNAPVKMEDIQSVSYRNKEIWRKSNG